MWHHFLDENEIAAYVHLSPADVRQRVKHQEIPHVMLGKRIVFPKEEVDPWASQRILNLAGHRLADYHLRSTRDTASLVPKQMVLPLMLDPSFIAPAMTAKTKASVLRELVNLATRTGRLNNPAALLQSLQEREKLCSTGMPGGFALPHPHCHDRYLFTASFIVSGRVLQPINFGAPDGRPTTLFFLVCCQDDRLHLHSLARICFITARDEVLDRINRAPDAASIFQSLVAVEQESLT
jgi:excisionase family DNA binding protein